MACASAGDPLLNDTVLVPDIFFTASSEWDDRSAAFKARLGADICWNANQTDIEAIPPTFFLQVCQVDMIKLLNN